MTSNEILKADPLDILFDNRNKQYGAYVLRRNYNKRLGMALGISLSTSLLIFLLVRPHPSQTIYNPGPKDDVIIRTEVIPEIKKPEPVIHQKKAAPVPLVRQVAFVTPIITANNLVTNPVPDQNALLKGIISTQNINGPDAIGSVPIIHDPEPGAAVNDGPKNTSIQRVQKEPEFPGGQEAWIKFLQKNLIAPSELEPGEKKTVTIRFVVADDGTVTGFEVMQSGGKIYDNEVIRVLKKMPKWKPAIQNGQAVPRLFTQPVTFMGVEG